MYLDLKKGHPGVWVEPGAVMVIVWIYVYKQGGIMKEMLWIIGFVGIYLLLQIYVLPKMGIST
jgi:hypothetical protein